MIISKEERKSRLRPILIEPYNSMINTQIPNVNINYLSNYFNLNTIIILCNDSTSVQILLRLGFGNRIMLSITDYDDCNKNILYL